MSFYFKMVLPFFYLKVDNQNLGPEYTVENDNKRRRRRQAETSENAPVEIREQPKISEAREKKNVVTLVRCHTREYLFYHNSCNYVIMQVKV